MSDLVPPEQPTGELAPPEPKNRPAKCNLAPPWRPGQSGNPAGRPRGSRSRLSDPPLVLTSRSTRRDQTTRMSLWDPRRLAPPPAGRRIFSPVTIGINSEGSSEAT
ncbi:DUF5681 domain-containing protein [Bradyrhizobium erythrophlei]|uniref:DUF5681 domain-containing protein n=1 Tax=Bradyrhizobium erythrophlei TaxID=1437360 RepID=UPI0035EEA5A2